MATKNYMINDKWLDLDKQNIVELQSVDGVLDSMKVNGSEIVTPSGKITITENGTDIDIAQYALADVTVEGGGGGGDFSTAEVTIASEDFQIIEKLLMFAAVDGIDSGIFAFSDPDIGTYTVPLYKGLASWAYMGAYQVACSGNITYDPLLGIQITGNGTITISAGE